MTKGVTKSAEKGGKGPVETRMASSEKPGSRIPPSPHNKAKRSFSTLLKYGVTKAVTKPYKDVRIYFGCPAKVDENGDYLPDALQPKSLDQPWHLEYKYRNPVTEKWERIREKGSFEINNYRTIKEREAAMYEFRDAMVYGLDSGYVPPKFNKGPGKRFLLLREAVKLHIEDHEKRTDIVSPKDHRSSLNRFLDYAEELGYGTMPLDSVETFHLIQALDYAAEKAPWGPVRYNNVKSYVSGLFNWLRQKGYIKDNPLLGLRGRKEPPKKRPRFTPKEREQIRTKLPAIDPDFYLYFQFKWYTGLRTAESLRLQIQDLDLFFDENFGIVVLPFEEGRRVPKGEHTRFAIIPPQLREILIREGYADHHVKTDYLFSAPGKQERDRGKFAKSSQPYFRPGPHQIEYDRPHRLWKRYVKDGMNIQKDMYDHKGSSGDEMALDGVAKEDIQKGHYGHDSAESTSIYLTMEQIASFKKIWDKVPDF